MSQFDALARTAGNTLFGVMGDPIVIAGQTGVGVVTPDANLAIGGGVQILMGAHLVIKHADFPYLAINDPVDWNGQYFIVLELDSVDGSGMRTARMAHQ